MRRTLVVIAALAMALAVLTPAAAGHEIPVVPFDEESGAAHHSDAGLSATASHSGASHSKSRNLTEIGSISFADGANTDVWALGNYAYVGTFSSGVGGFCPGTGVKIVDVSDPTNPILVGNLASPPLTRANDVKVETVNTKAFKGDLLVHTNEPCAGGGDGGVVLYDVSDPTSPSLLGSAYDIDDFFNGPHFEAFGVHNTWIFEQGNKAYLGVVANISPDLYDFRILDISDPAAPMEVGRWSSTVSPDAPPAETRGTSRSLGLHDVTVEPDGNATVAYLSYWDAGYILLDVSDPANPAFMGVTPWPASAEGNAHAAWPARGGNILVTSDEDFSANGLGIVTTNVALDGFGTQHEAAEAAFGPGLGGTFPTTEVAWIGKTDGLGSPQAFGCPTNPLDPASGPAFAYGESVAGKIALIQRGACRFDEKVSTAQVQGAVGVIVFNDAREDVITMGGNTTVGGVTITIPSVFIRGSRGNAIAALRVANTTVTTSIAPGEFNGWGFVRIWDTSDPSDIKLLADVTLPSTFDEAAPNPFGSHNVMVRGTTAYISWYADGLVAVDFSKPTAPEVVAQAVDMGDNYWGVYVQGDLIFVSDRDTGLKIYKHVPAKP